MIECLTPDVGWFERTMPPKVIKYKIHDDELIQSLITMMDETGDEMGHGTNLFCSMTEYRSQLKSKYKIVFENVISLVNGILKENKLSCETADIWCAKYTSGDHTLPHQHSPSPWSFCFYLNEFKEFPPLEIDGHGKVKPEKGLLVIFPGWVQHEVKPKEFNGSRYVCAGNVYRTMWKKDGEFPIELKRHR